MHSSNIDHIHVFPYQNIDITIVDKEKIPKMSLKSVRKTKAGEFLNWMDPADSSKWQDQWLKFLWCFSQPWLLLASVAMVITDDFQKNWIMMSGKFAKIVIIFVEIKHIKPERSYFDSKELDQYFPHYEVVTTLVTNFDQSCDCSIAWELRIHFFWVKM